MKQDYKQCSLWEDTAQLMQYRRLEGVAGCDVLIIGGGMAGILTAHRLASDGVDVVLTEAGRIGRGVTAGTTAKITSQHGLVYQKLLEELGTEGARLYLEAAEESIGEFEKLCRKAKDEDQKPESKHLCDFRRCSNYIYSRRGTAALEKELDALEKIGFSARFQETRELPFRTDGAVEFPLQACFHPLKFLKHITEGEESRRGMFRTFETTRITSLRRWRDGGWEAVSEHGTVLADQIVVASHFPFLDRRGGYFLKMYQSKSLVIAGKTSLQPIPDGMYKDEEEDGLSLRTAEGRILFGGGSGRPGNISTSWDMLQLQAEKFYPDWKTEYTWAAQDCMTLDGIPYIGPYYGSMEELKNSRKDTNHGLWTVTGFNKWGMTGTMTGARVLSDLICGRQNPYMQLFRPDRSILKPQLLMNAAESAAGLLKPKLPRCRHLGCALKWNLKENTWECPCHGSRYDESGCCLEGPSVKDLF